MLSNSNSKRQTYCKSLLLAAISPFHWIFAIFVITPPPCFTFNAAEVTGKTYRLARLLYALYELTLLGLVLLYSHTNSAYITNMVDTLKLDGITKVFGISINFAVPLVQLLSQLTTMLRYRLLKRIFDDIDRIEHDIRWRTLLPPDSAEMAFGRSFRWQLLSKSGSLMILLCTIYTSVHFMLMADFMLLQHQFMATFFLVLIQIKNVEFCVAVQMVQALLQQLLQELCYIRQLLIAVPRLGGERRLMYVALKFNQELLARIWQLVDAMEKYFTLPMLALFFYDALMITHTFNWVYSQQKWETDEVSPHNYFRLIFTGVILISMLVPCWICQSCIQTYEQFALELHNLRSNGADKQLSCCIREYSLQMMHQKLIFTCGGLFDINLQNFGSRVLTITTYVVILIQFKLQAEAEKTNAGNILQK